MRRAASLTSSRIRTIDVSALRGPKSPAAQHVAQELSSAFATDGFAVVVGHGIPPRTIEALREAARSFFNQPLEAKAPYDLGKGYGFGGYVGAGRENGAQLLGDFTRPADLVESLTLRGLGASDDPAGGMASDQSALDGSPTDRGQPRMGFGGTHRGPELPLPKAILGPAKSFIADSRSLSRALTTAARLSLGVDPAELHALVDPEAAGCRLANYPAQARRKWTPPFTPNALSIPSCPIPSCPIPSCPLPAQPVPSHPVSILSHL